MGESGSGKSQLFLSCLGLQAPSAVVTGSVRFKERELLGLDERAMNRIRGDEICFIPQDSLSALTPHVSIGTQLAEIVIVHRRCSRTEAFARPCRRTCYTDASRNARNTVLMRVW